MHGIEGTGRTVVNNDTEGPISAGHLLRIFALFCFLVWLYLTFVANISLFLENAMLVSAEQWKGIGPKRRLSVSSGLGVVMSAGERGNNAEELAWCREEKGRQG